MLVIAPKQTAVSVKVIKWSIAFAKNERELLQYDTIEKQSEDISNLDIVTLLRGIDNSGIDINATKFLRKLFSLVSQHYTFDAFLSFIKDNDINTEILTANNDKLDNDTLRYKRFIQESSKKLNTELDNYLIKILENNTNINDDIALEDNNKQSTQTQPNQTDSSKDSVKSSNKSETVSSEVGNEVVGEYIPSVLQQLIKQEDTAISDIIDNNFIEEIKKDESNLLTASILSNILTVEEIANNNKFNKKEEFAISVLFGLSLMYKIYKVEYLDKLSKEVDNLLNIYENQILIGDVYV